MLDQLYGKPSSSWKRTQVFIVLLFWSSRILAGNPKGPRLFFLRRLNRFLSKFTPWQIILSTFTIIYGIKHSDAILGLQAPEPLARLYSRNYYRATWIVTALDAGFATAMPIHAKWLRDILSVAFSGYYLIFASEADEKLRKYRAVCTVEMLRTTWEKSTNPYLRYLTRGDRPKVRIMRRILLPRPKGSTYTRPITLWVYFDGTELELSQQSELIFDIPGGGFICMAPEHHEERTLRWAIRTKRPVIGFDYGKAPEYPFPFAIDEVFDAYKLLHETNGKAIGMSGSSLKVVVTGDSAGANIGTAMVVKILESKPRLPLPVGLVFAYPCLSFHFTSWMPAEDLKVLRQESHSNIAGILRVKDHLEHRSPLSVVEDVEPRASFRRRRTTSWGRSFSSSKAAAEDGDDEEEDLPREEKDKSLSERIVYYDANNDARQAELQVQADTVGARVLADIAKGPMETRLAMTSRSAFFNDRIISPSMCRAMALLYIGPRNAPDLHSDYHISPIFTPLALLAQFPPVYLSCGERDPFVDDTVIFAGRLREAKEARKLELQGRKSKFGESLRMSASTSSQQDNILDETEENWVQMKIIEGTSWSHGYMQMISLLPEAVHAINMNADWIIQAFEAHETKERKPMSTPSHLVVPGSRLATVHSRSTSPGGAGATSESEKEEDVLSFTPRKRRGSGRPESPTAGGPFASHRSDCSSRRLPASGSSSDDAVSTSTPRTPSESHLSPPLSAHKIEGVDGATLPPPLLQLVSPHERALRAELANAQIGHGDSRLGASLVRRVTAPSSYPESMSDDERMLGPGRAPAIKTARSGSDGTLPSPLPANFVDAKDLLRRRREEALFGISAASSAQPSDEERD
ncbi:hypothetical protein P7C70_g794, partial [Phenoliferia sp. Uapishka_3]